MDNDTNIGRRPGGAERAQGSGASAPGRGGRMSRQRKAAAVLRLLWGDDLERLCRRRRGGSDDKTRHGRRSGRRPTEGEARGGLDRARPAGGEDRHPGGQSPFGPPQAQAMSRAVSPVSGKPYGLAAVCRVWRLARFGVYRHPSPPRSDTPPPRRRGTSAGSPRASRAASRCGTIMDRNTCRTTSRRRSASSASKARPPSPRARG